MTDFAYLNHGTVWTIIALSDEAKAFADEHFAVEDWMGSPRRFTTDWRPACAIIEQLEAEGFNIATAWRRQ